MIKFSTPQKLLPIYLSLLSFVLLYILDPLFYILSNDFGVARIPTGFFAVIIGCILTIFAIFTEKISIRYWLLLILLLNIFIGFCLSIYVSNYSTLSDYFIILNMVSYTTLGYYFAKGLLNIENFGVVHLTRNAMVLLGISSFVGLFFYTNLHNSDRVSVYLRPAHALAISSIFYFYAIKNKHSCFAYIFIGIIIINLIFINSRAAVLGLIFSLIFTHFFSKKQMGKILYILLGMIFIISLISITTYLYYHSYDGPGARIIRLIGATDADTSLSARNRLYHFAQPFIYSGLQGIGEFNYYKVLGPGTYIHDIRSYIAEFGLFGLCFAIISIYLFIHTLFNLRKIYLFDYKFYFIFTLIIYSMINMLFIQHFSHSNIFFTFGITLYTYLQKHLQAK